MTKDLYYSEIEKTFYNANYWFLRLSLYNLVDPKG